MKYLMAVSLTIFYVVAKGQSVDYALPQIIPPSPEVAQLIKAGNVNTGIYTGTANFSIPLYTLMVNKASVNVALNYSSNGIKVDDIPSRVGLGWNLIAGGVVSRVIHDEPDGDIDFLPPPENLYSKDDTLLNYLKGATYYDTEWDEYSYNFNGYSGSFFLDDSGRGYSMPHNNFKIIMHGYDAANKYVEITTGDGIKYVFGFPTKETTRNITISGGGSGSVSKSEEYEMAWFLDKIITPEGGVIIFNYSAIETVAKTGNWQTLIKPGILAAACETGDCNYSEETGQNVIEYDTHYLTSIYSDAIVVNFIYQNRPDASGDKRLTHVAVFTHGMSTVQYKFDYYDPTTNNNTQNKRYFLTKVKRIDAGSFPEEYLAHEFEYDDIGGMPDRLSYSQDLYGYYNGVANSYFAPLIPFLDSTMVQYSTYGGNRNPGTLAQMRKGVLTKVKYPTGGLEIIEYEPHTLLNYLSTPTGSNASTGGGGIGSYTPWVHTSTNFTANSDQTVSILLHSFKSPAYPDAPSGEIGEGVKIYEIKVKKASNGEVVFTRHYYYYSSESYNVSLDSGVTYYLELTIWGELNAGTADLGYNLSTSYSYENKIVGGLRVKSITAYDSVANKSTTRFYKYAAYNDTTKSSGVGFYPPNNYAVYKTGILCNPGTLMAHTEECNNYMISASSITPNQTFGGSNVAYTRVLESDDEDFNNGFIEHYFNTAGSPILYVILGNSPLNAPVNSNSLYDGIEDKTKYYKKNESGGFVLIKQVDNDYEVNSAISHTRVSHVVRKRFEDNQEHSPPDEREFRGYDLVQYTNISNLLQKTSSTVTEYDEKGGNPIVTTTNYEYGDTSHLQLTKISVNTSDNSTRATEFKYPIDFAIASPINVYQQMVDQHRIQDLIETTSYRDMVELEKVKSDYEDWFEDGKIIYPQVVKTRKTSTGEWKNRLRFYRYDSLGNVLEVSKENDTKNTYIWDSHGTYPIAQVINGSYSDIAYTSFESTEMMGSWSFSGSTQTNIYAITGSKEYNLNNGAVTKTVSTAGDYIISYWSKSSQASVNSTSPVINLSGPDGWTYYKHIVNLSSNGTVTVNGSVVIDELRLYPVNAMMTSMTIWPGIGVSTQTDARDNIVRYAYDGYNRLLNIKDREYNILKQYAYVYGDTLTYSLSTTANWVSTGLIRCKQVPPNNNYTGEREREERDMNSSSLTYLQYRFVIIDTSASCTPVSNCTGVDKRVVNGSCETGTKIYVYSAFENGQWECQYYYQWSDGHKSQYYMGYSSSACMMEF